MLTLYPGYTALVGPNGAGKTTLLREISDLAEMAGCDVFKYNNLFDGGSNAMEAALFNNEMQFVIKQALSSEGEKIVQNFGRAVRTISLKIDHAKQTGKPLFILLDALDSGMSLDRARDLLELFDTISRDIGCKADGSADTPVYIIAAVNQYELAHRSCLNPRTGKYVSFGNYEDYADYICNYFDD